VTYFWSIPQRRKVGKKTTNEYCNTTAKPQRTNQPNQKKRTRIEEDGGGRTKQEKDARRNTSTTTEGDHERDLVQKD